HTGRMFTTAVNEGTLTHNGSTALAQHIANMARRKVRLRDDDGGRTRYVFVKAGAGTIDRGIAAVLALEAAAQIPKGKPRVVSTADAYAASRQPHLPPLTLAVTRPSRVDQPETRSRPLIEGGGQRRWWSLPSLSAGLTESAGRDE